MIKGNLKIYIKTVNISNLFARLMICFGGLCFPCTVQLSWSSLRRTSRSWQRDFKPHKKSINLNPCFAEGYNNIAVTYKTISEFDKAIKYFDKSISLKADYHVAMLNKANCFEAMGDLTKAIEIYKEILKTNPNFNEALKNIGF